MIPNTIYDWNYTTTSQLGLNGRTLPYPAGRILGGTSSASMYSIHSIGLKLIYWLSVRLHVLRPRLKRRLRSIRKAHPGQRLVLEEPRALLSKGGLREFRLWVDSILNFAFAIFLLE